MVPALLDWYADNARDLPWRREPFCRDPYCVYVSEIMLQQTQVRTVIPFWNRWMKELPTIESAADASPDKLHKLWEGLGYYTRVRNLQKAARIIRDQHGGKFPERHEGILALPGVGRYTAGAIRSIAFNQPAPILDGNVIRVLTRVFGIGDNPKAVKTNARLWKLAGDLVQSAVGNCSRFNQSLMELGALICTPRNAQCVVCPVRGQCVAFKEDRVESLPKAGRRQAATARRFMAFVVERNGKFLVWQRPPGVVNAHLWEFPNIEVGPNISPARVASRGGGAGGVDPLRRNAAVSDSTRQAIAAFQGVFGICPVSVLPLAIVKHSITRYRITLEAFLVSLRGKDFSLPRARKASRPGKVRWLAAGQFDSVAFASAHKKLASFGVKSILSGR